MYLGFSSSFADVSLSLFPSGDELTHGNLNYKLIVPD